MALALDGVRILDNGIVQAGTFPSRLLADFGAEVIRVENYSRPDLSRNLVYPDGQVGDPYWEEGGTYHEQHRNKLFCVGLDVRKPAGRDAFLRIAKESDIVLDSHPPGVMEKLRLDYDALKSAKPDIIYISTSGYGYGGPFSTVRSYGMMTEIMCGSGWLNGYDGEDPRRGSCPLTDHPSTYHGAFIMMAALVRRKRTGKGIWLDYSQYEIGTNILGDAHLANAIGAPVPERIGNTDPGGPFSGCFKCEGSERWIAVSVTSATAWAALCSIVGRGDLAGRPSPMDQLEPGDRESLAESVRAWTSSRTVESAFTALSSAGVATAPANDIRDLLLDPHLKDRGFFWLVEQVAEQQGGLRAWPGASAQMSETPGRLRFRAPMLGEHNKELATGLLGYSAAEFAEMEADGAFGTVPAAADIKPPPADIPARTKIKATIGGGSKLHDADHMDRMQARFGPEYGS